MLSTHPPFALIADDLTGACDTGIQFAKQGFSSIVWFDAAAVDPAAADLHAITTDSRGDATPTAVAKVVRACQLLHEKNVPLIYKKIDSTLRGHVGQELVAALQGSELSVALVTPAFPIVGRSVADGWLHVIGQSPAQRLHVPTFLGGQIGANVPNLSADFYERPAAARVEMLEEMVDFKAALVSCDAVSDDDLAQIVTAADRAQRAILLAGSGGLAAPLAAHLARRNGYPLALNSDHEASVQTAHVANAAPLVLIIGSQHTVTRQQIDYLLARQSCERVELARDVARQAEKVLAAGRNLLLRQQWDDPRNADYLQQLLPVLCSHALGAIVLSGGDTAQLFCNVAGVQGIHLQQEILPGLPWGTLIGGALAGRPVCTKSGGFGSNNALAQVIDFWRV